MSSRIEIDRERCKGCLLCVDVCSRKLIRLSQSRNRKGFHFVEAGGNGCTGCLQCADMCPDAAIEIYTEPAVSGTPARKSARKEK